LGRCDRVFKTLGDLLAWDYPFLVSPQGSQPLLVAYPHEPGS